MANTYPAVTLFWIWGGGRQEWIVAKYRGAVRATGKPGKLESRRKSESEKC